MGLTLQTPAGAPWVSLQMTEVKKLAPWRIWEPVASETAISFRIAVQFFPDSIEGSLRIEEAVR
jgi:hypothetical protein